jgi:putative glycosyl hydrolase
MKYATAVVLIVACSLLSAPRAASRVFSDQGVDAPRGGISDRLVTRLDQRDRLGVNLPEEIFPDARGPQGDTAMAEVRAELSNAGGGWVRTDIGVGVYRAMFQNSTQCSGTTQLCDANKLSGFKVLGIIDHVTVRDAVLLPCGFAPGALSEQRFTLDDWKQLVSCVSTLFRGKISAYEIWNEPTVCSSGGLCFQGGYQDGTTLHYFEMLKSAFEIIKRNNASAIVVGLGGVQAYVGGAEGKALLEHDERFSAEVAKLGGRKFVDAISVHAYGWDECSDLIWNSYRTTTAFYHRLWNRPIWITETGQRAGKTCSQARYRNEAFSTFSPNVVDKTFWFALRDTADGAFGLAGRTAPNFLAGTG